MLCLRIEHLFATFDNSTYILLDATCNSTKWELINENESVKNLDKLHTMWIF